MIKLRPADRCEHQWSKIRLQVDMSRSETILSLVISNHVKFEKYFKKKKMENLSKYARVRK